LVVQRVAFSGEPLDDVHRLGVEVAVRAKPRVVVQVIDVDDERVAVPLGDRIAHV
jgi:hypothetical protein